MGLAKVKSDNANFLTKPIRKHVGTIQMAR